MNIITEENIEYIKNKYEIGATAKQLSSEFNVSENDIRNFLRRHHIKKPTKPSLIEGVPDEYPCSHCGKVFRLSTRQKYKIPKGLPVYCSLHCSNIVNGQTIFKRQPRPIIHCEYCGKLIDMEDKLTHYNRGQRIFYCNHSCCAKDVNKKMNRAEVTAKTKETKLKLYGNPNYHNQEKINATKLARYGDPKYNNHKLNSIKQKQNWKNRTKETIREIAIKSATTRKSNKSIDGIYFDSSYEKILYEYCIRNNIPVERQIPLNYYYNNLKHTTLIDFKIDGYLIECKGGHLLTGTYSDDSYVPIEAKLDVYKKNNVILVTDLKGSTIIPKPNSLLSNGLKYKTKCPEPLIGIDISLFDHPEFPYRDDRPSCYYDVQVMGERSIREAFEDEQLRWKMIKNRIEYAGGFISGNSIINALNITRTCKQPSWFSKKFAMYVISKYITTNTIYDPFAGWGARYDACEELRIKYHGSDLNKELVEWHISKGRNISLTNALDVKTSATNCSIFICPPYQNVEKYFEGQDMTTTQCQWLCQIMKNIPNATEYVMVCKVVDPGFEQFIVEEKINKSHFGKNIEYILKIEQKDRLNAINLQNQI